MRPKGRSTCARVYIACVDGPGPAPSSQATEFFLLVLSSQQLLLNRSALDLLIHRAVVRVSPTSVLLVQVVGWSGHFNLGNDFLWFSPYERIWFISWTVYLFCQLFHYVDNGLSHLKSNAVLKSLVLWGDG